jgi:hypothetical protein
VPSRPFKIEQGRFGLSLTDPGITDACLATIASFQDFTCNITSAALNASANVSDETTPATWCDPEQTSPMVGMTSYECAVSFLQDPQLVQGLSRFLFEQDTNLGWVYMGLDGDNPPKAVAKVRFTAGAFGGEARVSLTAEVTMPCAETPIICFGDAGGSESVPVSGRPVVTAINPVSLEVGPPADTVLVVTGRNFHPDAQIRFGTILERTDWVSDGEVSTIITGGMFPGENPAIPVTVRNVAAAQESTPPLYFAFTPPPPPIPPTVSNITPAIFQISAPATITLDGTDFDPTTEVLLDGTPDPSAVYVNAWQMTFLPTILTVPGNVAVTARTGTVTSANSQTLTVIA